MNKIKIFKKVFGILMAGVMMVGAVDFVPFHENDFAITASAETLIPTRPSQGNGTVSNPYQINSESELLWFSGLVNGDALALRDGTARNPSAHAKLTNDITISGNWVPIGKDGEQILETDPQSGFSGTFDGNGYTITVNMNYDGTYVGLFGYLKRNGVIKNLTVKGTVASNFEKYSDFYQKNLGGGEYVGGVCEYSYGTIENCCNMASVSASRWRANVGGVCGSNSYAGEIKNCYNTGSVNASGGENNIGGVVGNSGTVTNCYYLDTCGAGGTGTPKTKYQFESGEVCWLLNGSKSRGVWHQYLGYDECPVLESKPYTFVYAKINCIGEPVEYRNPMDYNNIDNYDDEFLPCVYAYDSIIKEATCTEKCNYKAICPVCKAEKIYELDALGHDYASAFTIDKEATCTEVGSKSKHCSRCDEKSEVTEIEATGHKKEVIPGKAATCTENGLTDGEKCTVCDTIITAQEVIPATGHNLTFTDCKDNSHKSVCNECGIETISTHLFVNGKCRDCGAENVKEYNVSVYCNGELESNSELKNGMIFTASAKKIDGMNFAYWTDSENGKNVLSTSESYKFYVSKDTVLYAVYTEEKVEKKPVVSMTNTSAVTSGSKNYVRFEATRDITDKYELVEHGLIYGNSTSVFGKGNESEIMKFTDKNFSILPNKVKKIAVNGNSRTGLDYLNVSVGTSKDVVVYARGYCVLKNKETGEMTVIYSGVVSKSFNSLI